jgi:hypothetical protein
LFDYERLYYEPITGTVEWPAPLTIMSTIILTVGITGGVLIRVFTWI